MLRTTLVSRFEGRLTHHHPVAPAGFAPVVGKTEADRHLLWATVLLASLTERREPRRQKAAFPGHILGKAGTTREGQNTPPQETATDLRGGRHIRRLKLARRRCRQDRAHLAQAAKPVLADVLRVADRAGSAADDRLEQSVEIPDARQPRSLLQAQTVQKGRQPARKGPFPVPSQLSGFAALWPSSPQTRSG